MDILKTGKFIKEHREKMGLSQKDLCEKVHVTRQAVSNWENGKSLPDSDVLLSLSQIFDVTINDILCGKSMEHTVLALVDENNKKRNHIKKMIITFSITIAVILISFFVFYFIENYNSIKVYTVSSNSEHFRIVDGVIISTSSNTYFKLGKIDIRNNEKITVNNMVLYYEKGNKKDIIFENGNNDRLYIDRPGYQELYRKKFDKYKKNLYLEISYNDKEKEVLKLKLQEDFSNNFMIMFDESKILKNTNPKEIQDKIDNFIKEENIQFEKNVQVRNDLTDSMSSANSSEQKNISPMSQTTPIYEPPIIEENKPTEIEETPPEPEESIEESQIDYEEIMNIIETYGTSVGRFKQLEYYLDNQVVSISLYKKAITVEVVTGNIKEDFIIKKTTDFYLCYTMSDNYIEQEKINDSINKLWETNPELIQRMNNFLRMVYQEIE